MNQNRQADGIHSMVARAAMCSSAVKLRDTYTVKPDAPLFHKTFGLWFCIDDWYDNGLHRDTDLDAFFYLDPPGHHELMELGWCEAAFEPMFEERVIEQSDEYDLVQDFAGRHVLYFKGRRNGFMPEYRDHPVKDWKTWEENVKWRLNPETDVRYVDLGKRMETARKEAGAGKMIQQRFIGGYMYLRSLIGPEDILYFLYDQPDLVHDCMRVWLELADAVTARHQKFVTFDEVFIGEDICYNHGCLISPEMMNEFLFPYYQQLISNIRSRQIDSQRHLYVQLDTDGFSTPVIDIYREKIGMDMMSPFEVAAGNDLLKIAQDYPDLVLSGGIDKRILAQGADAIDRHVETIIPVLRKRGGYIPTCDHGVPPEVTWENYLHYRKRCVEMGI